MPNREAGMIRRTLTIGIPVFAILAYRRVPAAVRRYWSFGDSYSDVGLERARNGEGYRVLARVLFGFVRGVAGLSLHLLSGRAATEFFDGYEW